MILMLSYLLILILYIINIDKVSFLSYIIFFKNNIYLLLFIIILIFILLISTFYFKKQKFHIVKLNLNSNIFTMKEDAILFDLLFLNLLYVISLYIKNDTYLYIFTHYPYLAHLPFLVISYINCIIVVYHDLPMPISKEFGLKDYFQLFIGKIKIKSCYKSKYKTGKYFVFEKNGVIYGSEDLMKVNEEDLKNINNYRPKSFKEHFTNFIFKLIKIHLIWGIQLITFYYILINLI